eukprot:gene7987-8184_t
MQTGQALAISQLRTSVVKCVCIQTSASYCYRAAISEYSPPAINVWHADLSIRSPQQNSDSARHERAEVPGLWFRFQFRESQCSTQIKRLPVLAFQTPTLWAYTCFGAIMYWASRANM